MQLNEMSMPRSLLAGFAAILGTGRSWSHSHASRVAAFTAPSQADFVDGLCGMGLQYDQLARAHRLAQ